MNAFRKSVAIRGFAWLGILLGTVWWPTMGWSNPAGGQVILGNATINALDSGNLLINQLSDRALIQWDSFSIAQGEITRFAQPGSGSFALNRVVGASPSMLNGLLQANGNVWLMNSNGVFVGPSGTVDVGGFMASTLDMSNSEFEQGGAFRLSGGSMAPVANMGSIRAATGDVYLVAHEVQNAGAIGALNGTVALAGGNEVLINPGGAHGEKVFISGGGGFVTNSGQITSAFSELKAHGNVGAIAVHNSGSIRATGAERVGGRVVLRAGDGDISSTGSIEAVGSGSIPGSIAMESGAGEVRIGGLLRATSETGAGGDIDLSGASVKVEEGAQVDAGGLLQGGRIDVAAGEIVIYKNSTLGASGVAGGDLRLQASGNVVMAGQIQARGTDGAGGTVVATGQGVALQEGASIDASGASGGAIRVGGGISGQDASIRNAETAFVDQGVRLAADGLNGNGGSVVVYANGVTNFVGQIDARALGVVGNGGFAEVSGKADLHIRGGVDTSAVAGRNGTFLIDPADVNVGGASPTITGSALSDLLRTNNVILYTDIGVAGSGNITVTEPVQWASQNSLAMLAYNDITVQHHIRNAGQAWNPATQNVGTGNIYLVAGWDGSTGKVGAGFGTDANANGVIGDAGDTAPGALDPTAYFDANFGPTKAWSLTNPNGTYGRNGRGLISIEGGKIGTTNLAGVVVGSRYGTTGLAGRSVQVVGNPSGDGFAQVGFRDNGRIHYTNPTTGVTTQLTWSDDGDNVVERGEISNFDENYWWANINPDSALPGQGLNTGYRVNQATGVWVDPTNGTATITAVGNGPVWNSVALPVAVNLPAGQTQTISQAVTAWNAANPTRQVTASGDAAALNFAYNRDTAITIQLTGGEDTLEMDLVSGSDAIRFRYGNGNLSDGTAIAANYGGMVGELASQLQPEWHGLQAYNPLNVGANASAIRGDIAVNTVEEVSLIAGIDRSYAQIGHVGANGDTRWRTTPGTSIANNILFLRDGDDDGLPGGDGATNRTGASEVDGAHVFDAHITVNAGRGNTGHVLLLANRQNNNPYGYAMIGHGGSRTSGVREGNITVNGPDGVHVYGGRGSVSFAAIGHATAELVHMGRSHQYRGDITVNSTRGVVAVDGNSFVLSDPAGSYRAFAQIGHGGPVEASNSLGVDNGYGNRRADNSIVDGNAFALGRHRNLMLNSNAVEGNVTVHGERGVTVKAGNRFMAYAQIGHDVTQWGNDVALGGSNAGRGRVNRSDSNITLAVSSTDPTTGAMTGGWSTGSVKGSGNIQVTTNGSVSVTAGSQGNIDPRFAYAMIGMSGYDGRLDLGLGSDITVAAARDVLVYGGSYQSSYAQIGNGGDNMRASRNGLDLDSLTGDISVIAGRNVLVQGGDARPYSTSLTNINNGLRNERVRDRMYAMIGNGGFNADYGYISGDLLVRAGGDVTLKGGAGDFSWAMVGNGGASSNDGPTPYDGGAANILGLNRGFEGNISVIAEGNVSVLGGAEVALDAWTARELAGTVAPPPRLYGRLNTNGTEVFLNYAQIGHGGPEASAEMGANRGTLEVFGKDVLVQGGEGVLSYAQVGHGGPNGVNLNMDLNLDTYGNLRVGSTGTATAGDGMDWGGDALDVGYLFLIRPSSMFSAGPDGILGSADDGLVTGYATANMDLPNDGGQSPDVRFFAWQPGVVNLWSGRTEQSGNRVAVYATAPTSAWTGTVTVNFPAGTLVSQTVAAWNADPANANRQIRFEGNDFAPTTAIPLNLTDQGITLWFNPGVQSDASTLTRTPTVEEKVNQWNSAYALYPTLQIGVLGRVGQQAPDSANPTNATYLPSANAAVRLTGGINGRFGADGIPYTADDREATTGLLTANIDYGQMQSRRYAQDDRHGDVYVNASGNLSVLGGNRGNANSNYNESFAYSQIGHGGPGSQGSTSGDIQVTVGGDLLVQGNFAGDGIGYETPHDEDRLLDVGTAHQGSLDLTVRTSSNAGYSGTITLTFDGTRTLGQIIAAHNSTASPDQQVEIGSLFKADVNGNNPANNLVFKSGRSLTLGGGIAQQTASATGSIGGRVVTLTAANPGAAGNNIFLQVAPGDYLTNAVNEWNTQNPTNQIASGVPVLVNTGSGAITIQFGGGVDGRPASGSQTVAWLTATPSALAATDVLNPFNNALAGYDSLLREIQDWNADTSAATTHVQRGSRIGLVVPDIFNFNPINGGTQAAGTVENLIVNPAALPDLLPATAAIDWFLTGGVAPLVHNWNMPNTATGSIGGVTVATQVVSVRDGVTGRFAPSYLFGNPAPASLGVSPIKGDAYAKIGHGEDVRDLIREPGMYQNALYSYLYAKGDVTVYIGGSGSIVSGAVGHVNSQYGSQSTPFDEGNTHLAVSLQNPSYAGPGSLSVSANSALSSGFDGSTSQLRIFAPLTSDLNIGPAQMNYETFDSPAERERPDVLEQEQESMTLGATVDSLNFSGYSIDLSGLGVSLPASVQSWNGKTVAPKQEIFAPQGGYNWNHGVGGIGKYTIYLAPKPESNTFLELPTPEEAYGVGTGLFTDQIDRFGRVDERRVDDRTFTFNNYWSDQGGWRTSGQRVSYMGGLGGGNALVLDENGILVPMPINLDPNASESARAAAEAAGTTSVPVPPVPSEEQKKNDEGANAFGTSVEGTGVNTTTPPPADGAPASPDMGGASDMGGGAPAEAAQPAPAPAPAETPAPPAN